MIFQEDKMKSIGLILTLLGAMAIIYYLVSIQSGPNTDKDIKESREVVIENEKVDIRDLHKLKKSLDDQAKAEEERMKKEIEKATGE
jgi:rRNA processing protein Gar1